eukprot:7285388-Lingulodinium_polyedra.AAC.1
MPQEGGGFARRNAPQSVRGALERRLAAFEERRSAAKSPRSRRRQPFGVDAVRGGQQTQARRWPESR